MSLFLYLGYSSKGQRQNAQDQLDKTLLIIGTSDYWQARFHQYHLDWIMESPPSQASEVESMLYKIKMSYGLN